MSKNNSASVGRRLKFAGAVFAFGMVCSATLIWLSRWLFESTNMPSTNFVAGIAVIGMFVGTVAVTLMTLIGRFDRSITALDR